MKTTRLLGLALILTTALLSGCSHFQKCHRCDASQTCGATWEDIEFASAADEKVNFPALKTFAWGGNLGVLVDETGNWQAPEFDVTNELDFLIERELRRRGFVAVRHDPDVFVVHALVVDVQQPTQEEIDAGLSIGELSAGALLVQLMDGETLKPIWRGAATAQANQERTSEEVRARLDYAVRGIFETYPAE